MRTMRNELAFQTKLVNVLNDMGGHAFKCNNRFKAGVLDLHLTLNKKSEFIECKFERCVKGVVTVEATPKQKQFARRELAAGGRVRGLVFVQHAKERNTWALLEFSVVGDKQRISFNWRKGVIKWSIELQPLIYDL